MRPGVGLPRPSPSGSAPARQVAGLADADEDFAIFLEDPTITKSEKAQTIQAIAKDAEWSELTSNFLGALLCHP